MFFFSCGDLVWFWYPGSAGLKKGIWKCSLYFYVLEALEKNWY